MKKVAAILCAFALLSALPAEAKKRWELKLTPQAFDVYGGSGVLGKGLYLYMVFEVENPTEQTLSLNLRLKTETDVKNHTLYNHTDPLIEKGIARAHGLTDYKNAAAMRTSTISPGEKVTCLAVFGKLSAHADKLDVVVGGLIDQVTLEGGKDKRALENRELILHYVRPGDEYHRQRDKITFKKKTWRSSGKTPKPYR